MGKLTLPKKPAPLAATLPPPAVTLIEPRLLAPTSTAPAPTDSLPLRQLRLFVAEVLQLLDGYARSIPDPDAGPETARRAAEEACDAFARSIASQTLEIARSGSTADRSTADELRYLKAAMADELLLTHPWPGRTRFTDCLVETRLFGSSVAGDEIFRRIELLLNGTGQSPQMAPLYLFAISTGFEGRYRGPGADEALKPLRDELFRKIYLREPTLQPGLSLRPRGAARVLSPQAYRHPLSELAPVRFFRISRPTVIFLLSMALLLGLSQALWLWQSAPVRRALEPAPATNWRPAPSEAGRG